MRPGAPMDDAGLGAVLLDNRDALLRFLRAHGAGDAAEDLFLELWLRVRSVPAGPVAQPLGYLYRAAGHLMIDRHRSQRQAAARDRGWQDAATGGGTPAADRVLIGRETLAQVAQTLAALGPRVERIFRRHRIDGIAQRDVAAELGVSLSTVESDLRRAARALIALRATLDQGRPAAPPSSGTDDDRS